MNIKGYIPLPIRRAYRGARDYAEYRAARIELRNRVFPKIRFYGEADVIDQIATAGKSLARFGDGEFMWLMNIERKGTFQHADEGLSRRLSEVLGTTDERMIVGVLKVLDDETGYDLDALIYWLPYKVKYYGKIMQYLDAKQTYADSYISRPYMGYRDKSGAEGRFRNIRRIWDGKRVLIVEGEQTRLGVGNDLMDQTLRIGRILCPAENAFDRYDEILQTTTRIARDYDLVLLALGPTATVLAYDLCRAGIQAVDIGHIDVEYEWFRMGARKKVKIEGRSVHECAEAGEQISNIADEAYQNSVVARVL